MQWFFLTLIRIFDRRVKRDRRGPSSLDAFRKRAMNHICVVGIVLALANGLIAWHNERYAEIVGLELPIFLVSLIGYILVHRSRTVEWTASLYMLTIASCMCYFNLAIAQTSYVSGYVWFPLIGFGTILLCGRFIGMLTVTIIFLESLAVVLLNSHYGFVLPSGMDLRTASIAETATLVSAFLGAYFIMASVEVSRQRADRANEKNNALNLKRASLSLLGDMGSDISRNMQAPLTALNNKLNEVMSWNPEETLHQRGNALIQNLNQSLLELGRQAESLLLFSRNDGAQDIVTLRAVDFLNHLNELTRVKAIARGVSLDFSADQPQAQLHLPAAAALFALVSLVNKGVEAAAGQEQAWVRLQVRVLGRFLQIRVLDSGPSLSYRERRAIQEQTSQNTAWDVNLRLSLDFLASIEGQLSLDPYSPDTCYVLRIPLSQAPVQSSRAA